MSLRPFWNQSHAQGFHLYPGLVAVQSEGLVGAEPPEDSTDAFSLYLTLGLAGGVTTAVSGNTAVKLSYGTLEDHVLKRNLFYSITYSRQNPSDRQKLRGTLDRVRQYIRDLEQYELAKPQHPAANVGQGLAQGDDEHALKLLRHETTAVATANTADQLRDLTELAQQYGFQLVARGPRRLDCGTRNGTGRRQCHDHPARPLRSQRRRESTNGSSIENARILAQHGVPLAVVPLDTYIIRAVSPVGI